MHPDEESAAQSQDHATGADAHIRRQFAEIVTRLRHDDPPFARRCSLPRAGGFTRTDVMILVAVLAVLAVGVIPLAVGVHLHVVALLVVGSIGCLVGPTVLPWAVGRTIERRRPLWT